MKKEPSAGVLEKAVKIYKGRMQQDINKNARFLQTYVPNNFRNRLKFLYKSYNAEDYRYSLYLKLKVLKTYLNKFIINNF